jgi:hypothetical protein
MSSHDASLLTSVIRQAGRAMWSMLLWNTREVYVTARDMCQGRDEDEEEEGEGEEGEWGMEGLIDTVINTREQLLATLSSWMDCRVGGNLRSEYLTAVSQLQCEAFRMIGDVRMAYPMKEEEYECVKRLAWSPSMVRADMCKVLVCGV